MSKVVSPNFPQVKSTELISIKSCCDIVNLRHQIQHNTPELKIIAITNKPLVVAALVRQG